MADAERPSFDSAAVARDVRIYGLVLVAGAGLSMGPPSSLPGWTTINEAFLENLAMCLALHTDGEVGYDAAGANASVYCAPEDFERLPKELESGSAPRAIPVIKVHGSVDRVSTMVDTLRQRVLGRPSALEAALARLFREHAVL